MSERLEQEKQNDMGGESGRRGKGGKVGVCLCKRE